MGVEVARDRRLDVPLEAPGLLRPAKRGFVEWPEEEPEPDLHPKDPNDIFNCRCVYT